MGESNNYNTGIGFFGLLAIVFITLRLTDYIDWSWWWVLAPLWAPIILGIVIFLICILVILAMEKKK